MRIYFFVLFFVAAILSLFSPKKTKINNMLYILFFLFLFLFAGFRDIYSVVDALGYQELYYEQDNSLEITFTLIISVVKSIFNDYRYLFLIYAAIGVYLKFRAIKLLSNIPWSSIVIYFPTYYLLHEMTQMRAAVASGLFLISIPYLKNKDKLSYFSLITVAILFHSSAIVLYPLYFIIDDKFTRKTIYYILILTLILIIEQMLDVNIANFAYLVSSVWNSVHFKVDFYIQNQNDSEMLNVLNLVYFYKYGLFFFLFLKRDFFQNDPYFATCLKIYGISLFIYIFFSRYVIFSMRFSELIGVVEIIITPYICYFFGRNQIYGRFLVVLIAFCYLLISLYHIKLVI